MVRNMMGTSGSGEGYGGGDMSNMRIEKPAWLERLMEETFFGDCGVHKNRRKNEKNIFCLHCCLSICPHCLPSHRSHPLLQVLYTSFLFTTYTPAPPSILLHPDSFTFLLVSFFSSFHSPR